MFVEYPEKNTYILPIITSMWSVVLKYEQATAEETDIYYSIASEKNQFVRVKNIYNYWKEFAEKHIYIVTKNKWRKSKNEVKKKVISLLGDYVEKLEQTYHKSYESKYKWVQEPYIKNKRINVFDSSLFIIKDMTGIPVDEVKKRLTYEQIGFIYDKARFDYYETFETWKQVNTSIKAWNLDDWQRQLLEQIKKDIPTHLYTGWEWHK